MTEDQKWERYNTSKLQTEADQGRMERKVAKVVKKTLDTIARHKKMKGVPKEPMPSFRTVDGEQHDVDEYAFKDVTDMAIVTEGKGLEGWDAIRRDTGANIVESSGWKDAKESSLYLLATSKADPKTVKKVRRRRRSRKARPPQTVKVRKFEAPVTVGKFEGLDSPNTHFRYQSVDRITDAVSDSKEETVELESTADTRIVTESQGQAEGEAIKSEERARIVETVGQAEGTEEASPDPKAIEKTDLKDPSK